MAHNYNDNGTIYEIGGGKDNMNGTVYEIDHGSYNDNGTVYEIRFAASAYTVTITGGTDFSYPYVVYNGNTYKTAASFVIPAGASIVIYTGCGSSASSMGYISIDGVTVASTSKINNKYSVSYTYTPTSDISIQLTYNGYQSTKYNGIALVTTT